MIIAFIVLIETEVLKNFLNGNNDLEGWFFPGDMISLAVLDAFQYNYRIGGGICEVGVYKGKSLAFLSHFIKENEKLFGYDLFREDYLSGTEEALKKYGSSIEFELIKADTSELTLQDIKTKLYGQNILKNRKPIRFHAVKSRRNKI